MGYDGLTGVWNICIRKLQVMFPELLHVVVHLRRGDVVAGFSAVRQTIEHELSPATVNEKAQFLLKLTLDETQCRRARGEPTAAVLGSKSFRHLMQECMHGLVDTSESAGNQCDDVA